MQPNASINQKLHERMPKFDDETFNDFAEQLFDLDRQHRLRQLRPRRSRGMEFVGASKEAIVNFGSNDYLGIAATASIQSILTGAKSKNLTSGSSASALVCGWSDAHEALANKIARLEETEAAVLFPSGYAACSGAVATLALENDLILSDELNHASLIDGCRLSRAQCMVYPHRDVEFIADVLKKRRLCYRRVWIVTDGVFSMDGHIAPLVQLCDLGDRFDAEVIVDEAHGTGVLGKSGSGVCEALEVKDRVHIRIGTLSKALGGQGGFVVGPRVIVDFLINHCRPLIFSTSLLPAAIAVANAAIDIVQNEPQRRSRVATYANQLRKELGIRSTSDVEAGVPIIPIVIGEDEAALKLSVELQENGFYVPVIRPPTVPKGTSRLRVSLSAAHDQKAVKHLVETFQSLIDQD